MIAPLRQRAFALLWAGSLISRVGDWVLLVGLPLEVYRLTGSPVATGATFFAGLLPTLLLGSVAGVFVDRWDHRRTLIIANVLLALGLLPLLAVHATHDLWIVYTVSFLESALAQFSTPAAGAFLPQVVAEDRLVAANALNGLGANLTRLVGPPLGGVAAGLVGLTGVALLDAVSFLVASALLARVRVAPAPPHRPRVDAAAAASHAWSAIWHDWVAGLAVVRHDRVVSVVFLMAATSGVGEGVFITLLVPFVTRVLHGGGQGYGWFLGAQAIGGVLGSILLGRLGRAGASSRFLALGALGLGLIDLAIFNYPAIIPGLTLALILVAIAGVPGAAMGIGMNTVLQTVVADAYRGRVLGAFGTTLGLFMLAGTVLAGALGDRLGIVPVLNIQGGTLILTGALALLFLPRGGATVSTATVDGASASST